MAENPVHVHSINATILNRYGIDHSRFSVRNQELDVRLTGSPLLNACPRRYCWRRRPIANGLIRVASWTTASQVTEPTVASGSS